MSENKKIVPRRRFKEYQNAGDWEQRRLEEMSSSFEYGLNAAAKKFDGKNKYIRITDIDDETRLFLKLDLTSPDVELSNAENYQLQEGDIVFARTGASVGKTYIYKAYDGLVYYAGFLIRAKIKPKYCADFVFQNTLTKMYERFINITSQRSGQPGINAQEYASFEISIPKYEEQMQIGAFFRNFDTLITFHQRKLEKMKALKAAYLSEMFSSEGERKPKRRFKGFTDDWERRKFADTFIFLQNNSLSRVELNHEQGAVKNIHYGDVLIKFGELIDVEKEELPFISKGDFTVGNKSLIQNGDVIIADAAEDATVGKCCEAIGLGGSKVVSGLHTIPCRPIRSFSSGFLGYYMNSNAYHDQLLPLIQGTKISSISKTALQDTDIIYPKSDGEQRQIGSFFCNLDHFITLHQRTLEKLQNIKTAYLNEMFVGGE